MRHNFGESGVLLKCGVWWGWWGSSENEGKFGGAALPAEWKKLFKKKVFFPLFCGALRLKKKVGLFPLKERFFGVPHFNAKFF